MRRAAVSGDRAHVDVLAVAVHRKLYDAVGQCEERVVFAHADVLAGADARSALADQDVAGNDLLAAEALDAQPLRVGVAAVPGGTRALFRSEELKVEYEHGRSTIAQRRPPLQAVRGQASAKGTRLGAP
jgi:hypothetical protein